MRKPIYRYKRAWLLAFLIIGIGYLLSLRPIQIILQTAPNTPRSEAAIPALPSLSANQWGIQRPELLTKLEQSLYGQFPDSLKISILSRKEITSPNGLRIAKTEVFELRVTNTINQKELDIDFILLSPTEISLNNTLIISQNFCPNHNVVPAPEVPIPDNMDFSCDDGGVFSKLMLHFFGRYIVSPPFEAIIADGYSVGVMHPSQFISDNAEKAQIQLDDFFSNYSEDERPAALISWAALSTEIADLLSVEYPTIVTWGHSRFGKTALLAAAYSDDIDGAIAHQSGTGGASLFRNNSGETLADIVGSYPHWFSGRAQEYADNPDDLPLDQHFLLSLLAPKPVLLGNARRDVWSDPEGAFRAAQAASEAYQDFSVNGMSATRLDDFKPDDELSFWIRPGTHGVVEEDWPAFLEFMEAHFPAN